MEDRSLFFKEVERDPILPPSPYPLPYLPPNPPKAYNSP